MKRFILAGLAAVLFAACKIADQTPLEYPPLPPTAFVEQYGLYKATTDLCGINTPQQMFPGRQAKWALANPEIAKAKSRIDGKMRAILLVESGEYKVPRDLCAN